MLLQHVTPDVDQVVRRHAQDVRVVGCVVDLAEGETVRDFGPAALVAVGEDMGGVK